jgi:hypothetical protein
VRQSDALKECGVGNGIFFKKVNGEGLTGYMFIVFW